MSSVKTSKYSLPVKTNQNFGVLASQNCNFHKNLIPLEHFCYFSSKALFVSIIYQSFQKDLCKSLSHSTTFNICFLALYKMIQQNLFKSLAVSSKQIHFLSTKKGWQVLSRNSGRNRAAMLIPSYCFIRLDEIRLENDIFHFGTGISYVKQTLSLHYCSHIYSCT